MARSESGCHRRSTRWTASGRGAGAGTPAAPTPQVAARELSRTLRTFRFFYRRCWPWPPLLCGLVVLLLLLLLPLPVSQKLGKKRRLVIGLGF